MALDQTRLDDFAGMDEVVANQRVRGYRKGTPYGGVSDSNASATGTMWMQGTGVPTSFASGNQTYTAQILGGGLIVHNTGTTATNGTLDTTANIIAYANNNSAGFNVGDIIQCQVFNTGTTGVLTIVAGDASTTFDANGISTIAGGVSKTLNIRLATASTLKIYM